MIYLETNCTNPYFNLAFEEWVLTHFTKDEYLILWQNENSVIIGQNQNTLEEIDPVFVKEHKINVVRRTTGGGAVYHDLGNLNYSFITDYDRQRGTDMSIFTDMVVKALTDLGLPAEKSGRNDILVDGKKVSGTAQRVVKVDGKERILYHGTLLFRSDPEMIAGALRPDPLKFSSKATKSVRSRVGNISDYMPEGTTLDDFWKAILRRLDGHTDFFLIDRINFDEIIKLQIEKYLTYEWNYGKSPLFRYTSKQHFAGGTVDVRLNIEKGVITEASIFGDFLSLKPASEIAGALCGVRYDEKDIRAVLSVFEIGDYMGQITKEELLSVITGMQE